MFAAAPSLTNFQSHSESDQYVEDGGKKKTHFIGRLTSSLPRKEDMADFVVFHNDPEGKGYVQDVDVQADSKEEAREKGEKLFPEGHVYKGVFEYPSIG